MSEPTHPDATPISTLLDWQDLVLDEQVRRDVEDIRTWIAHRDTLLESWQLRRRIDGGYRSLFLGPPGTGKTLTACLLGKSTNCPVHRVDLRRLMAKYADDTVKQLDEIFRAAEPNDWLLLFDEADALFGGRSEVTDAHDRYANREVAYLLQRIESYPGVVILASNLRSHMDDAFTRRFQSVIQFSMPTPEERFALWRNIFGEQSGRLADDVDIAALARDYELAGGGIVNVLRHACLRAIQRQPARITQQDLMDAVRREAFPNAIP